MKASFSNKCAKGAFSEQWKDPQTSECVLDVDVVSGLADELDWREETGQPACREHGREGGHYVERGQR